MPHFVHRTRVRAPLEAVAAFHRDTQALKRLTPPPVFVQLHQLEPLAEGSQAHFTLWLGPLPVHWEAVHQDVDELHGFSDHQARGPYRRWVHRHSFRSLDAGTTEIVDDIQAEFGRHPVWGVVSRLMWLGLPGLFAYRSRITRRSLEGKR